MKAYELMIETFNPCGSEKHGKSEFLEIQTDDPIAYVKERAQLEEVEVVKEGEELVLRTNQRGYVTRYTFTEI